MEMTFSSNKRLVSLDVMRGLTVMLMIFVNNGAGNEIFSMLRHPEWNGFTLADQVFPFFLFIVGISTYLSMRKFRFEWSWALVRKIIKRTVLLFLIGLVINWLDMACDGRPLDFAHLRIMGVMQRIALCYGFTAFLVLVLASVARPFGKGDVGSPAFIGALSAIIVFTLVYYATMLLSYGGYNYDSATNFLAQIDTAVLGADHLYVWSPIDPEGLFSTISAACNTMIGFLVADLALTKTPHSSLLTPHSSLSKPLRVFIAGGIILGVLALAATTILPLNKRVWSPSYVLATCSLACLVQALLIYLIDVRKKSDPQASQNLKPQSSKLQSLTLIFGTNPLFLYVASEFLGIILGGIGLKDGIYNALHTVITNGYWASVAYSTLFLAVMTLMGYPLWKRHIYIKL